MPTQRDEGPEKQPGCEAPEAPRVDLPPEGEPSYGGYLGTEEEEVVPEEDASGDADRSAADRSAAEDAAGGDQEIG